MSKQSIPCIPCGIHPFSRNTYYFGKVLTERDFNDEAEYLIGKARLHNSLLHGYGTVCGLKVQAHPNPECRDEYVYIAPGMALDCCGREIILPEKYLVSLPDLIAEAGLEFPEGENRSLFISLCFDEKLAEKVPVIMPDCDCADQDQAYNRIQESVRVCLFAEKPGDRQEVHPALQARLDWLHTLTLAQQSPRALAIDEQNQQIYVAAQALPDDGTQGARLYAYRSDTHDLITAVNAGSRPTDLALTLLGDLIILATGGLERPPQGDGGDTTPVVGLAFYEENKIRAQAEPSAVMELGEPARLLVSPHTGALFALSLTSGKLQMWTEQSLRDWLAQPNRPLTGPPPAHSSDLSVAFDDPGGPALRGAAMLSITPNGSYLFIADAVNAQVRMLDVADFSQALTLTETDATPVALVTSLDSQYLTVLWQTTADGQDQVLINRYVIDLTSGSPQLRAEGRGGQWPATPRDLTVAPDERWAYVLQTETDETGKVNSLVQAAFIYEIAQPSTAGPADPRRTHADISGLARAERLAALGSQLYVTADDESSTDQPDRGLVAVISVAEAACDELFNTALDGCAACDPEGGDCGGNCLVLAHIPGYQPGQPVQDAATAQEGDLVIDNLTYRPLVPNTNNIVEVIRCMLENGVAERLAGPRGPEGPSGPAGPGITEVDLDVPQPGPGELPTVRLEPISGDPAGNQRLVLGIPPGADGDPGVRGPGITEVTVSTLAPGSPATAALQDIAGDPENDKRLVLGIPQGQPGTGDDPDLTHITNLSWRHGQLTTFSTFADIQKFFGEVGIVIAFDSPVVSETIITPLDGNIGETEILSLYARHPDESFGMCECEVRPIPTELVKVGNVDADGTITDVTVLPPDSPTTEAIRLRMDKFPNGIASMLDSMSAVFFRVIFRSDFALNEAGKAVDGNHIGGQVPKRKTGNGRQGTTFESWFTIQIKG